jgi:hypothetical protein
MKRHFSILFAIVALALAAPALANDTTVTGTVVSSTADSLVISAADGQKTFVVNDATLKPMDLAVGSKVTVTFRDEGGQMIASQVSASDSTVAMGDTTGSTMDEPVTEPVDAPERSASTATTDSSYSASASASATTSPTEPAYDSEQVAQTDPAAPGYQAESTVGVDDTADDDALPATASKLPLLALIGLLACAGAVALRRVA